MARNNGRKIKLLLIYTFLYTKSNEENPIETTKIIKHLADKGIKATRQTIYEDIQVLNAYGFDIICVKSRSNKYFVAERIFELPEVHLLLNIVIGSKFLTVKKTAALIEKVSLLSGEDGNTIKKMLKLDFAKHNNERIYYNIDAITNAISNKKKVSFRCFEYAYNGKRIYYNNNERFIASPVALMYSMDTLYLVCFQDNHGVPVNYRVDKMDEVKEENEDVIQKDNYDFDISAYKRESFLLFSGEQIEITITFPANLINATIDKFGEDVRPVMLPDDSYMLKTNVMVSNAFFAWLTIFEGQIKIDAPISLREMYKAHIKKIYDSLN